jgi:hypothetical protein
MRRLEERAPRGRYVVAELHGRLGNQLFQFASGYGIARRRDARLLFHAGDVRREDLLLPSLLGAQYRAASARELLGVGHFVYRVPLARYARSGAYRTVRAWRRARGRTPPSVTYWEQTGQFRAGLYDLDLPVYIQGHLQSERYFADYADEIANALVWPEEIVSTELGVDESTRPTVGVSFRRGDYIEHGWALPFEYYEEALDRVSAQILDLRIVLFGDDAAFVELAGDRLGRFGSVINAVPRAGGPLAQLRLLSLCDHCVISNSSFAWWGAWLGDQRAGDVQRIVIAPREYGEGGDRVPARWDTIATGTPPF